MRRTACHVWCIRKNLQDCAVPQDPNSLPISANKVSESARRNQLRQQKSALDAFFVYVVFVICYLPHLVE